MVGKQTRQPPLHVSMQTDDLERDYNELKAKGVNFVTLPRRA